ncbi:MAG: HD domain-containing phosphohydrolase [Actinomycetota bacterium]
MSTRILFVDDEPNVLSGFKRVLHREYEFDTAVGGAEGLALIDQHEYAVVVSDMRMPEMSGEEFLAKAHERQPDAVQMILSGQANLESTVAAVNNGNIFRFLVKPVEKPVLTAALDRAIRQYGLIEAEKELLQKTLSGAVAALTEVVTLVSPSVSRRTGHVVAVADHVGAATGMVDDWQLRLAAMLSGIGFAAVPTEIMDKAAANQPLNSHEQAMLDSHPEVTGRLLGPIPRLEGVSSIIRAQAGSTPAPDDLARQVEVLDIAVDVANHLTQGLSIHAAIFEIEKAAGHAANLIEALHTLPMCEGGTVEELPLRSLQPGMVLRQDVMTQSGLMLASEGTSLTVSLLERIRNFSQSAGVDEPIRIESIEGANAAVR